MEILKVLLILVEVLCCFLLVGVILLQRSKNEGMGGLAMGAGMGEQLFGSRAGNVLTRTTIILACVFMGTTTLLAIVYSRSGQTQSIIERKAAEAANASVPVKAGSQAAPAVAPAPAPAAPAAPAPTAAPVEAAPAVTIPPVAAPAAPAAPAGTQP